MHISTTIHYFDCSPDICDDDDENGADDIPLVDDNLFSAMEQALDSQYLSRGLKSVGGMFCYFFFLSILPTFCVCIASILHSSIPCPKSA